ncbi:MAG: glycogen/starch synthase [Patescibacteria group bacterium]|jgi:starch synthase
MKKKFKIVSIASEVEPYSKTGGLGDVARSLPKSLFRLGHDVIIITPYYQKIINTDIHKLEKIYSDVSLHIDKDNEVKVAYYRTEMVPGLSIYFVHNDKYFSRRKSIYGSNHENARFYMFSVAALKLVSLLKFNADIIHCHDWHTGLIPHLKKTRFKNSETLSKAATVYTIHNLIYQMGRPWWEIPAKKKDNGTKALLSFSDPDIEYLNFAKRGILEADIINTVSETYAEEIMEKDFGQDLHRILVNRKHKLFGVVNGIDYKKYNPKTDRGLHQNYTLDKLHRKLLNKRYLQKFYKLPSNDRTPLIGLTSRIAEQKGLDLTLDILPTLLLRDVQVIIMGDGDKEYIKKLKKIQKKFPEKLRFVVFDRKMETSVYAGADMFLLPSRFEPCGINQLISFRYGCVPIVRSIGGLSDTVVNFDPETNNGNGFTFKHYNAKELLVAVTRALETYKYRPTWKRLVREGMKTSFSWDLPAQRYIELYKKAIKFKKDNGK